MLDILVFDETLLQAEHVASILNVTAVARSLPIELISCYDRYEALEGHSNICIIGSTSDREHPEIALARSVRNLWNSIHIIFLLHDNDDISAFVKPDIRPSAIIYHPLDEQILGDMLMSIFNDIKEKGLFHDKETFVIQTGSSQYNIAAYSISFIESRGKRVAMKTLTQEIEFYSGMDAILSRLPSYFMRCHKGYIVNTRRISTIRGSTMSIELDDGCVIPYSRSYRESIKGAISGKVKRNA